MLNDILSQSFEQLRELPGEVGTEVVGQIKSNQKATQNQNSNQAADPQQQQYLQDLYGSTSLTQQQVDQKQRQDLVIMRQRYQKIQQDIQEYRAKKRQEKTKYEIGWQEGTEAARTQEEEQEMWQKQQKKAQEEKKKEADARLPGNAAKRGGEQGKIMG